ncbi:MAG: SIS domain-containing protein [Firmicutes bacterium]|nr:SIS domain-containing protein [Bacillota bacterium]
MSQFLQDIKNQPRVLSECFRQYIGEYRERLQILSSWREKAPKAPVVFVGMGSSLYAPLAVTPFLNRQGIPTYIKEAGELFHYGLDGIPQDALVIAVSQSGESIETKNVVEALQGRHKLVAITNHTESSIAKEADLVLPMFAGEEAAASTKTFVASILVLYLASKALFNQPIETEAEKIQAAISGLEKLTGELIEEIGTYLEFLGGIESLNVIGRGPTLASVYHGALIMKETAGAHAEGLAGGTFRHGPLELAGPGHRAIIMAPTGKTSELGINLSRELAEYGSKVLLLSDQKVPGHKNMEQIVMPAVEEDLASILYILPLELLAWDNARRMGWNPGIPRLITKVTIRE